MTDGKSNAEHTYPMGIFARQDSKYGDYIAPTFNEFCDKLRYEVVLKKESVPLFCPALLKEEPEPGTGELRPRRKRDHVIRRTMLFLDIDGKAGAASQPDQPNIAWGNLRKKWSGQAAIYTSFSHTPAAPRYRVCFPIDPDTAFPAGFDVVRAMTRKLGLLEHLDTSKVVANSLFYFPAHPPGAASFSASQRNGAPLTPEFFAEEIAAWEVEEAERKAARAAAQEAAERKRAERIASGDLSGTLIEKSRDLVPSVEEQLDNHRDYSREGERWLYKGSTTGVPGVVILEDSEGRKRAYSHHAADPIANYAGGLPLDNLDLLCLFRFGGDEAALWSYLSSIAPRTERFHSSNAEFTNEQLDEEMRQARREQQRKENEEIGETLPEPSLLPEIFTPEGMVDRFLLLTKGSEVVDLLNPRRCYAMPDFINAFRASKFREGRKETNVTTIWGSHPQQKRVESKTFHPGAPLITTDPEGRVCVNTWTPCERRPRSASYVEHVAIFTDHIDYLFGADAARFLDWAAHIEQQPGVLPHTAWLHISTETGTGRNAMSGILSRIWAGRVAASFDLVTALNKGFNGRVSGKILAIVDEIREGGSEGRWEFTERLKSFLTEEHRAINPKYQQQYVEHNCMRLIMFSNHIAAIPIDEKDRRIEVVVMQDSPRDAAYYKRLYGALKRPSFINDLALFLGERDLSGFEPGARARESEAKTHVAMQSESEPKEYARALAKVWPADIVPSALFHLVLDPLGAGRAPRFARAIAAELGFVCYGKAVKVRGKAMRLMIIRNASKWKTATAAEISSEVAHKWYDYSAPRDIIDAEIASLDEKPEF